MRRGEELAVSVGRELGAGKRRIDELQILDGFDQRTPFDPGIVLRNDVRRHAFRRVARIEVWSAHAGRIYAQALASQWDPNTAIAWTAEFQLPSEVEDAVVQIMTYLIENETAALIVPLMFSNTGNISNALGE